MKLQNNFPFFHKLDQQGQEYITQNTYLYSYKLGDILSSGHDCIGLLMIVKGSLRVYMISEEGREISLYHLSDNELCLFSGFCMFKDITFHLHIEATVDTDILVIPSQVYKQLMETYPSVSIYTNQIMSHKFSEVMWLLDQVLNKKLDSRIAAYLFQKSTILNSVCLSLTHEDIANELGTAREVISRILKYLEQDKIISLSRGLITVIDLEALKKLGEPSLRK